jgi:hypothetical protein
MIRFLLPVREQTNWTCMLFTVLCVNTLLQREYVRKAEWDGNCGCVNTESKSRYMFC